MNTVTQDFYRERIDKIRYDAAIPVPANIQPEASIGIQEMEGGKFAVCIHKGPYENLHVSWNALITQWITQNGCRLRNAPSFEIYLNDPQTTPAEALLTEIYAPLED